jgi:hypothetical protein
MQVNGEERRELMELQYRIGKLELENMELEQSRIVHESLMKGKDLTIQKLFLQVSPDAWSRPHYVPVMMLVTWVLPVCRRRK